MSYQTSRKEFSYTQINEASPERVFQLLCPVREKDWIDGWEFEIIYSQSGFAEQGCVFSTPHHGSSHTIWYITKHDAKKYEIEFVRVTPNEQVVKIFISLKSIAEDKTQALITYEYTGLNETQVAFIQNGMEAEFIKSMTYWERAINHYLKTGKKLMK